MKFPSIVMILFLTPLLSSAQIKITADTLLWDCDYITDQPKWDDKIVIDSQEKYDQSDFRDNDQNRCLPYDKIDFSKSVLVGFIYHGSRCDRRILSLLTQKSKNEYLIQFTPDGNGNCRDLRMRVAWFVIDRPQGEFVFSFEQLYKDQFAKISPR